MKKIFRLFALSGAVLLASCSGDNGNSVQVVDGNDSISFASGVYVSRNLRAMAFEDMGVDTATVDEFIAGIRASFPLEITPEAKAYAYGLSLGASAMDMYEKTRAQLKAKGMDEPDRGLFLEGVIAAINEKTAAKNVDDAVDYYIRKMYRDESDAFMQRNSKRRGVESLSGGLQYKMERLGSGVVATIADTVVCKYKGFFPDGEIFDTSAGEAVEIPVSEVIPGLSQALTHFPVGTVCTLYVPWQLGYGARGADGIPPYKTLVFEIEIVGVKKK